MDVRLASAALAAAVLTAAVTTATAQQSTNARGADEALVATFDNVSRNTAWTKTATIPVGFDAFHPQSMEVVGDRIYLSSVEILERPVRYPEPVDGYDRTPGKGVGHLFVLDREGTLLHDIVLGEGHMYHPGGIDVDDSHVYVPVAEYRPNSAAILYRIDTTTFEVEKLFTVRDHVGGVIRDRETGHLVGQSWGSRRFYDWTLGGRQTKFWLNENHFLDYQDCEYVASRKALCSGITGLPAQPGAVGGYELGGFVMLDLADRHRMLHEVPLQIWSTAGHVITRNPTDLDADGNQLTLYAAPDDTGEGAGTQILVYEADVTPLS
jgi:hypothetical protein